MPGPLDRGEPTATFSPPLTRDPATSRHSEKISDPACAVCASWMKVRPAVPVARAFADEIDLLSIANVRATRYCYRASTIPAPTPGIYA
jgi:hypothetical protein